jgi:uncharacterized protein YndB with AHSA1/START domain
MDTQGLTIALDLDASREEVFAAVLDVRGWWSESVVGETANEGDEWDYAYQDVHDCRIRVTDVVPGERVEWLVVQNRFSFTEDPAEWVGTRMVFDLQATARGTALTFTHVGLVDAHECYGVCVQGWDFYIGTSLRALAETGRGRPSTFDHRAEDAEREPAVAR